MKQVHRLESQRSRLFGELGKTGNTSERLSIEKVILDIDTKIMNLITKSSRSATSINNMSVTCINKWAKDNDIDLVLVNARKMRAASSKAIEKIEKLLKDDLEQNREKKKYPKKN